MTATRVELSWESGQRFETANASGAIMTLDGDGESGFSPTEALLSSVGACMGIDVVVILEKMRAGLEGLDVTVDGERMAEPPRYFRRLRFEFRLRGNVPRDKAEQAVNLSLDKYCSVLHTLRNDIEVETVIE